VTLEPGDLGTLKGCAARFVHYTAFLAALAEGLAATGEAVRGLAVLDEALAQSDKSEERWILAELLRLKGELVLLQDVPNAAAIATDHFEKSLALARRQGALAWELRSATSLARLWHRQRKTSQARTLLAAVCRRFTEGFDTTDVVTAKTLLKLSLLKSHPSRLSCVLRTDPLFGRVWSDGWESSSGHCEALFARTGRWRWKTSRCDSNSPCGGRVHGHG
jgi:predicted ATPase